MSFDNIRNNTSRCKNIVNAEEHFARDVSLGADAPQYMYYTPNLLNDAHNTNVSYAARDLRYIMDTMLSNPAFMKNTLITITFDENGTYLPHTQSTALHVLTSLFYVDIFSPENFGTPNHIYTVLLGNDTLKCYNCIDQQYYNREYRYSIRFLLS